MRGTNLRPASRYSNQGLVNFLDPIVTFPMSARNYATFDSVSAAYRIGGDVPVPARVISLPLPDFRNYAGPHCTGPAAISRKPGRQHRPNSRIARGLSPAAKRECHADSRSHGDGPQPTQRVFIARGFKTPVPMSGLIEMGLSDSNCYGAYVNRTTRFLAWHSSVFSVQAGYIIPHGTPNTMRSATMPFSISSCLIHSARWDERFRL
jgi:hypothetical protein